MMSFATRLVLFFLLVGFFGCAESEVTIFSNSKMTAKMGTLDFAATEVVVTKTPASGAIPEGYTVKGSKNGAYPFISFTLRSLAIGDYPVGTGMPTMPVAVYAISDGAIETAVNGLIKITYIDNKPGGKIQGEFNFSAFYSANPINYGKFTAYFP